MTSTMLLAPIALLAAVGFARADVFPFDTPSGNIYCTAGIGGITDVGCTIYEHSGQPLGAAPTCARSQSLSVMMRETGRVTAQCGRERRGQRPSGLEAMPYGHREDFGGIVCTSQREGFRCTNRDGHGFFLSRGRQEVF